jgi:hypothetical protein
MYARGLIVVEMLVSSMKTSRFGSSVGCCFCRPLRAAATSGRSCFKGQLQMMQKSGDRRPTDRHFLRRQNGLDLSQRDIRLFSHQLPDQLLVRRQSISLVTAKLAGLTLPVSR